MSYTDYEWFLKEDLTVYAGKWVAILNKKVIASGKDAALILKETEEKYPKKRPFLAKVKGHLAIV